MSQLDGNFMKLDEAINRFSTVAMRFSISVKREKFNAGCSTQGKNASDALAVQNNIREQALLVFLEGISDRIKLMVKSKHPSTLEQAIQIAIIEDKNTTPNEVKQKSSNFRDRGGTQKFNKGNCHVCGIIHSGIISTRELRMQLRDILISLPGQLKLPFDVNYISLYELSKISKLAIVYMNGTLVFELVIPLLNPVELTLYHIIPLPVRKDQLYMHLTPEFEYMAISKTHEYYLTISVTHLMNCRELASVTMCPEKQPLRMGSAGLPCEIELFMKTNDNSKNLRYKIFRIIT
ncbi:uncharacterized protein LOC115034123 [Acyrthosiphon pisum]|uniref:Uncharacterized protein n=1 Tax=Acyrthosiphon pisum TaxID=7029 RepID=A0A8R2JRY7_ACYPI|nr:uncharacterized protein LOC115034123 [Acyrthosiphon pisum]